MTYQQAVSRQRFLDKCSVIRLELWDNCLVIYRKDGEVIRFRKEDLSMFKPMMALVKSGNFPPKDNGVV